MEREPIQKTEITHMGEYPVIPEVINGVKINFVGVAHNTEFLKTHYDKFKTIVQNSSHVFLESATINISNESKFLKDLDAMDFFDGIVKIAENNPKKISVIDPLTNSTTIFSAALAGAAIALTASKTYNILTGKENLTRRNLIKLGADTLITYSLAYQGIFGYGSESLIRGADKAAHSAMTPGLDDTLAFNEVNYRNAFSAYAIDFWTKQHQKSNSTPIVYITGSFHPQKIISYLKENKTEGQIKKKLYDVTPYGLLGKQSIRNYEFANNQWQLTSKIPL